MAEAIVGPLLSKLQEVAVTEAKALAGVGGQIDSLRDKLMWLHALLHEIEQRSRHDTSRFRRVLASQIREVALQAEDAIDRFYLEADLSRRGWRRAAKEFVTNFRTQVRVRFLLSRKIQSLNARLEEIIDNSGKYGSVYTVQGSSSGGGQEEDKSWKPSSNVPPIRHEWNWEDSVPFKLIGLRKQKEELEEKLMNASVKHVIYVSGVSGTGKRALLRYAFENERIRRHFDVRISVSFPPGINEESIVQQIKGMLLKECSLYRNTINQELRILCVMVLISSPISIAKWSKVEGKLLEMVGQGSKIVVSATSESEGMPAGSIIRLEHPLNDNDSKILFNHAIGHGLAGRRLISNYRTAAVGEIRDHIMDITNGLPLAVVLVAKFMVTMDFSKWGTASNYITRNNNETVPLKRILLVCIDDLPDELKSCLLYTAGFPENRVIDAKQLVRLWMAEGFLAPQHGMEGEQLGQCYLKELIYRGLLQLIDKSSYSTSHDGGGDEVESVAIHELIHPVFRSEVRRTAFMYVHSSGRVVAPDDTRRLALQNYDNRFLPLGDCYNKLRTVVSFCYDEMDDYLEGTNEPKLDMSPLLRGSPYLRVMNLEGLDVGRDLPDEIGDMVHLRYLGIRCRLLRRIPSSIGNLRNLQTMDVRGTQVRRLPRSFWKIRTLRHVLGDGLVFPSSSGYDLESMHTLETVTISCWDMMAEWSDRVVGRGKRGLRFLHRLHVVDLDQSAEGYLDTVLEGLRCLESLSLSGVVIPIDLFASAPRPPPDHPDNNGSDLFSCLEHVASLELKGRLKLTGSSSNNDESIDAIKRADGGAGYYNRCLFNLSRLVLRSTQVSQDFIDVIAKLPALAELSLLVDSYNGTELVLCAKGFSGIRVLLISGLVKLETIIGPDRTKRMNKTISATAIKMPHVTYETRPNCYFCDSSRSQCQPPNITSIRGDDTPAHAPAAQPNPATGKGKSSQEISEEVQTGDMNSNPVPRTRSRRHMDQQLETDDEAHDQQAKQQPTDNLLSEEEQEGNSTATTAMPIASEGATVSLSHRGRSTRRRVRILIHSLSLSNKARVEGTKAHG